MKKAVLLSLLTASALMATELKFYGGVQDIKHDSDHLKTFEVRASDVDNENNIAGKLNFGIKKGGDYTLGNAGGLLGYQFGSPASDIGALRVYPLGLGYLYAKNDNLRTKGKLHMLEYKLGAEYAKDDIFAPNFYLTAGAYYTHVLSSSATYDGYKTTFADYKPRGYQLESELGYRFTNGVIAGVNLGYSDIDDDGFYLEKGWHAKVMVGYKF